MTPLTLKALVALGANVHIANGTPTTLKELATLAKSTGSHITVVGNYPPPLLKDLAEILGNQLTVTG